MAAVPSLSSIASSINTASCSTASHVLRLSRSPRARAPPAASNLSSVAPEPPGSPTISAGARSMAPTPTTSSPCPTPSRPLRTPPKNPAGQDFLEVPIAVENVSSYAEFHVSQMTEWEFLNEVVEQADCGILLDVNNIYVSSQNHSFDPRLRRRHTRRARRTDPHRRPLQVRKVHPRHPRPPRARPRLVALRPRHRALRPHRHALEWDDSIPSFEEVHAEALKANRFLQPEKTTVPLAVTA